MLSNYLASSYWLELNHDINVMPMSSKIIWTQMDYQQGTSVLILGPIFFQHLHQLPWWSSRMHPMNYFNERYLLTMTVIRASVQSYHENSEVCTCGNLLTFKHNFKVLCLAQNNPHTCVCLRSDWLKRRLL